MKIRRNIIHTQTKNCTLCLHIGTTAIYFGKGKKDYSGAYLRIFTPDRLFKFSKMKFTYSN